MMSIATALSAASTLAALIAAAVVKCGRLAVRSVTGYTHALSAATLHL